ncbi:MAG: benzoate/H(+) symporter BenE family transporter [Rhodoluna sp.]|nr:benzoate/H(+) symporter BenE family transporter [Rhodoluna sp.]MBP6186182.1 benzoate/H(+) symporter BenE family transporter [Rhodoluna sp.]
MAFSFADHKAPMLAGSVASITGQAASTGVVLAALTALGANQNQIISVIFSMLILYGVLSIVLSWRYKMPLSIVWSTPGAALLVSAGALNYGFETAVGAFIFAALMIALTGLWPALGRLVTSIPKPIASAMLAGVIFSFCIAPFKSLMDFPLIMAPVLVVWLVLYKYANIWATPVSMVLIFTLTAIQFNITVPIDQIWPSAAIVIPQFSLPAIVSIGIPLFLVTMASQNIPGIAIMKSFGYEVPFRPVMLATGFGSLLANAFGGFVANLAAITAALNANEHAHKDPSRRWLSSVYGGVVYLILAAATGAMISFVIQSPREIVLAGAGLALFGTIVGAFTAIVEEPKLRLPAVIAFLVASSGMALFSIGSAFWALAAGVLVWRWLEFRANRDA